MNNSRQTMKGKQGKKDSKSRRVNLDNERTDKLPKTIAKIEKNSKETVGQKKNLYTRPDSAQSKPNDISWYARNPQLLASAASVPFGTIIGAGLDMGSGRIHVPGVMQINWMPTIGGYVEGNGGALVQSANSTYDFLVHANSRNYTYEAPDLMIMILGGAQPFAMLSAMIRAFGVVQNYKEPNRYKPDALLQAMGFIPDDLRRNLSNMWFDINELINSTRQLWIPNTMPLLQRWFWLNGNYFVDSTDSKAQIYIPVQSRYWMYQPTLSSTGGMLTPLTFKMTAEATNEETEFRPGYKTYVWADWVKAIRVMIKQLIDDEDRGNMFGDILNAYGAEKIYALPELDLNYKLEPLYSPEVLSQIENLSSAVTSRPAGVAQSPDRGQRLKMLWDNNANGAPYEMAYPASQVLNFHIPSQPTPGDIMIATRLKTAGLIWGEAGTLLTSSSSATGIVWKYDVTKRAKMAVTSGTEVVTSVNYIKATGSGSQPFTDVNINTCFDQNDESTSTNVYEMGDLMSFDWHPFLYDNRSTVSKTEPSSDSDNIVMGRDIYNVFGDYDNYTNVSYPMLQKMHATAIYSLLGVPQM